MTIDYSAFSTRKDYNQSIRHFRSAKRLAAAFFKESGSISINRLLQSSEVTGEQVPVFLNSIYLDKYHYRAFSFNLERDTEFDPRGIAAYFEKKNSAKLICLHYDSSGLSNVFDPKNVEELSSAASMKKHDLLVVYCNSGAEEEGVLAQALYDAVCGKIACPAPPLEAFPEKESSRHADESSAAEIQAEVSPLKQFAPKRKALSPLKSSGVAQVRAADKNSSKSPLLGVVVTNELFHNGNVEAWKRVIDSYERSFPGNKVNVYYKAEKITDLNTLFQWGKVKSGTSLMFDVEGTKIEKIAKLKRYLYEAASSRFGPFLRGAPHRGLKLF